MDVKKFVNGIDAFSDRFGRYTSWIILSLVILTVFEVFTRRILGAPTIWTLESTMYLAAAVCCLALGYTELYKGHASVDILFIHFSDKTKAICTIISFLFFTGLFSFVLIVYGIFFFWDSVVILEKSASAFNAPVWPSKLAIPVGGFLLFIQNLSHTVREVYFLAKGVHI